MINDYTCPRCHNVFPSINKMLHERICTEENPVPLNASRLVIPKETELKQDEQNNNQVNNENNQANNGNNTENKKENDENNKSTEVKDINKIIKNEMKAKPFCAYFTLK